MLCIETQYSISGEVSNLLAWLLFNTGMAGLSYFFTMCSPRYEISMLSSLMFYVTAMAIYRSFHRTKIARIKKDGKEGEEDWSAMVFTYTLGFITFTIMLFTVIHIRNLTLIAKVEECSVPFDEVSDLENRNEEKRAVAELVTDWSKRVEDISETPVPTSSPGIRKALVDLIDNGEDARRIAHLEAQLRYYQRKIDVLHKNTSNLLDESSEYFPPVALHFGYIVVIITNIVAYIYAIRFRNHAADDLYVED